MSIAPVRSFSSKRRKCLIPMCALQCLPLYKNGCGLCPNRLKAIRRLEQVIVELQLLKEPQERTSLEAFIRKMLKNIEVEAKNNDAFTVSYTGEDPQVVMQVAVNWLVVHRRKSQGQGTTGYWHYAIFCR